MMTWYFWLVLGVYHWNPCAPLWVLIILDGVRCVQEARRGHSTSTKAHDDAVKALKKNAVAKVGSLGTAIGASSVASRAAGHRSAPSLDAVDDSKLEEKVAHASVGMLLPSRQPVTSTGTASGKSVGGAHTSESADDYDDDTFEDEAPKASLALLRNKRAARRQRAARLVITSPDASGSSASLVSEGMAEARGRKPTQRVRRSSRGSSQVSRSPVRESSQDSDVIVYEPGAVVGHRTGFGYVPQRSPARQSTSPPTIVKSPVSHRLIRTPGEGQLPDLTVRC